MDNPADSCNTISSDMKPLKFIDLFAGIGGFRMAFEKAGGQCVFSSEWDKFARQTYEANFGEHPHGDIRQIASKDIPDFDVLCAGFPCQPFSIAGVSKKNALGREHGFKDKTQGDLFFEIVRIIRDKQPRAFLLENVKNLASHNKGATFATILDILEGDLGYHIRYDILNASDMLPQNRARLFIAGFKSASDAESFTFPELPEVYRKNYTGRLKHPTPRIKDILEKKVDPRYTLTDHLWNYLQGYAAKHKEKGNGFGFGLVDPAGISRTLSARYYKDGSEILIPAKVPGQNPRRLTPRECARLMGFPDSYQIVVSDTQAYKQFGNGVAVPVVTELAREIQKTLGGGSSVKNNNKSGRQANVGKKSKKSKKRSPLKRSA